MHTDLSMEMDVTGKDTMDDLIGQGATFQWEIMKWSAANMMFVPASTIVTEKGRSFAHEINKCVILFMYSFLIY